MNSLNIISSRVIGASTAPRPRSRSHVEIRHLDNNENQLKGRSSSEQSLTQFEKPLNTIKVQAVQTEEAAEEPYVDSKLDNEETPLLEKSHSPEGSISWSRLKSLVKRIADALTALLTTIGIPIVYVAACFQDENGRYSVTTPLSRIRRSLSRQQSNNLTTSAVGLANASKAESWESEKFAAERNIQDGDLRRSDSSESLKSTTSESETEKKKFRRGTVGTKQSKPRPAGTADEPSPTRRSIRIKINNEDNKKRREPSSPDHASDPLTPPLTVDNIKSPTSPSQSLKVTRYPHAPQPPRPLVPRRQPSYSNLIPRSPSFRSFAPSQEQKTLIIDLDETLIHSLAKGGRMSSGHMVEVKLNTPVLAPVSSIANHPPPIIGAQHPILYYVHKRPHCDEFLRKICKWYKLVVFTASVQEYADPVIDWLELERKFFVGRYYRQHCTFRNGAYIKDLSSIEPDLSRVMILDNSPMSYIFHQDNAIPIEGWINDPTDNDLLHLIPFLESLQYVTDVRALLALRRGEADA